MKRALISRATRDLHSERAKEAILELDGSLEESDPVSKEQIVALMRAAVINNAHHTIRTLMSRYLASDDLGTEALLETAVCYGSVDTVKLLVETYEFDFCAKQGRCAWSAVEVAVMHGRVDMCEYFMNERGVKIKHVLEKDSGDDDDDYETAFEIAIREDKTDVVDFILKRVDDDEIRSETMRRAFLYAIRADNLEAVDEFISKGADVNHMSEGGSTPLHFASLHSSSRIIKRLILKGANLETHGSTYGRTPLHTAVMHRKLINVRTLVESGADLAALDNEGCTPIDLCVKDHNMDMMQFFMKTTHRSTRSIVFRDVAEPCAICTESKTSGETALVALWCGHSFHSECMNEWLARGSSCPICRRGA